MGCSINLEYALPNKYEMEIEAIISFLLLACALVSFFWEKISIDVTALALLATILLISFIGNLSAWPSYNDILMVFSAEAPITIAAMFVISAALNRCRIIEQMTDFLGKFCKLGYSKFMLILFGLIKEILQKRLFSTRIKCISSPKVIH